MFKKHFTPQEANKALLLVRGIVADILSKAGDVERLAVAGIGTANEERYKKLLAEIESFIDELEELGCFFKDWNFEQGLVDFPAMIDGREVLLCWRSDELDIRWYHGMDDGFPGRLPIPEHLLGDVQKISDVSSGNTKLST